ncbi:hypothetical protein MACH05_00780 [Qipengyuania nanhaisediminis]
MTRNDAVLAARANRSTFIALLAILVFAIALGGGGSKYGLANLMVQLAALVALSFHRKAFLAFWSDTPLALRTLVLLTLLVPLIQIIPLPPAIWTALPGRELVAQSLSLVAEDGAANAWYPASLDPIRTLLALTGLIAPLALLVIGFSSRRSTLITIGWIAVALGLANFLLGVPQVLSNSETGVLYPENPMPGILFGTFANRNSTGLFLVGVLALATLLPAPERVNHIAPMLRFVTCVLLVLAIVLTRSRTAIVLALIPLAIAGFRIFAGRSRYHHFMPRGHHWIWIAGAGVVVTLFAAILISSPGRMGMALERFDKGIEDARIYIWDDSTYAAERYWPVGSGMGTFSEVFQVDESLENMTVRRAGRAHNDYLEVAIEAGLPGLALVAAWLVTIGWLSWRARRSPDRWIAWAGATVLLCIALQSITDYPLRNQALLVIASLALVLLVRFSSSRETEMGGQST